MEGFAFNTRRPLFADVRVREALGDMFDFGWVNRNLYGGLYRRTASFFADSPLASTGRPADAARARACSPPTPARSAPTCSTAPGARRRRDGSGRDRAEPRSAPWRCWPQAGDALDGTALRQRGRRALPLRDHGPGPRGRSGWPWPIADSLRRIGIEATVRLVDEVQYQRRRQGFDFDMMLGTVDRLALAGRRAALALELGRAAQPASFNLAGRALARHRRG